MYEIETLLEVVVETLVELLTWVNVLVSDIV
jgi:hypothetical protein